MCGLSHLYRLMWESEDIAAAIIYAVTQPPRVNVNEILIRPIEQG